MEVLLLLKRLRPGLRLIVALLLAMALAASLAAAPVTAQIGQDSEQEADSGDIDQSGNVSQTGDNSNQCVNQQLVGNTGNAQNQIDVAIFGAPAEHEYGEREWFSVDDVEFDDVGSTIEVSPESSTECTQEVNQAASAASTVSPWLYYPYLSYPWLYWDGYNWLYWDGYDWVPHTSWSLVSNVSAGALDAATGTTPLVTLGALTLIGTAGILFRRNRRSN